MNADALIHTRSVPNAYYLRFTDHSTPEVSDALIREVIDELEPTLGDMFVALRGTVNIATRVHVIELGDASSVRALIATCRQIQAALERRGASGVLDRYQDAPYLLGNGLQNLPNTTVALALRLADSVSQAPAGTVTRDDVALDVVNRVLSYALDWCSLPGGDLQLHAGYLRMAVSPQEAPQRLRWLYDHVIDSVSILSSRWPSRVRICAFTSDAHLVLIEGSNSAPPTADQALEFATNAFVDLADAATYGFALRTEWPDDRINFLAKRWARRPGLPPISRALRALRTLEVDHALDAYPCQYFGPDFRTVPDNAEYEITRLANGGQILTSRHADRWLAEAVKPEPELLAAARAPLSEFLVDQTQT